MRTSSVTVPMTTITFPSFFPPVAAWLQGLRDAAWEEEVWVSGGCENNWFCGTRKMRRDTLLESRSGALL